MFVWIIILELKKLNWIKLKLVAYWYIFAIQSFGPRGIQCIECNEPSEMDVAPWCCKWDLEWMGISGHLMLLKDYTSTKFQEIVNSQKLISIYIFLDLNQNLSDLEICWCHTRKAYLIYFEKFLKNFHIIITLSLCASQETGL